MEYLSRLLSKPKAESSSATPPVIMPEEQFLELTKACEVRVTEMLTPNVDGSMSRLRVNDNQCNYLAEKLKLAVQEAQMFLRHVQGSTIPQEEKTKCLDNFKVLHIVACAVESFIQNCCKDAWVEAALLMPNMSQDVLLISFDLALLANFFSENFMIKVDIVYGVEASVVGEKARSDGYLLRRKMEILLFTTQKSSAEYGLADFLLKKLEIPGTYRIESLTEGVCLGKGASARVYRSTWLGIDVAVKTFQCPSSEEFQKEVSIVGGLSHPNVASMFCCAEDDQECSIVMELMDCDLSEMMRKIMRDKSRKLCYPFSIFEAVDIMLQVGNGVEYLHEKKIVHRDLKAANILVKRLGNSRDGESRSILAKVADFGLSRTKEKSMTYSMQTSNTGTARWMAPEVIQWPRTEELDDTNVTMNYPYKSDVFSFGMVCYEILTGGLPYSEVEYPNQVKKKIQNGERPQLPAHCFPELKDLILRCWSQEASERPRFDEICAKLRNIRFQLLLSDSQQRIVRQAAVNLRGEARIVVGLDFPVRDGNSSLNVLLLGPTGVGKSTFINALCNYLVYPSLDEALTKDDVQSLIYSEFTTSTFENRKLVKKTISVGERDQDAGATNRGTCCTQKCKAYNFVA